MKRQTLCAMGIMLAGSVALAGCSSGGSTITALTANYTESQVMGYLYEAVIEAETDIEVEVKTGLPSTAVIVSAMEADEGQLATMYTGEITNGYFPFDTGDNSPEHYMSEAQKGFKEHYNFKWYDALGFENQYAFAVSKDYAEEHDLKTLSDLNKVADSATVRVETQWLERDDDGYTGFQDTYGFEFADVKPMEVSLIYKAIDEDKVDVGLVYTTDAGISLYDLVVLEDDMRFFPPYLAAAVIKNETLEKHPEVGDVLQRLEGSLSEEIMRELNGAVSLDGKKPQEAVEDYLAEHELLR